MECQNSMLKYNHDGYFRNCKVLGLCGYLCYGNHSSGMLHVMQKPEHGSNIRDAQFILTLRCVGIV